MILFCKNNLRYFTFSLFNRHLKIRHGVFTRHNGASVGDFASLNTGLFVGDTETAVATNRQAIGRCIGADHLIFTRQTHQSRIQIISKTEKSFFLPSDPLPGAAPNAADAMITDVPGMFLAIQVADCQSVLLYDPKKHVAANIHAGWRGSAANIIQTCVRAMETQFGCRPEHLIAGISPSLGPCCAEFTHYKEELPASFRQFKDKNHYFDFWRISQTQLTDAGIMPQHIEIAGICTKCNGHLFFSYRKKHRTGRFVSVIGLQ